MKKQQIILETLVTLVNSLNRLVNTNARYVNKQMYNTALNEWLSFMKKQGSIIHNKIPISMDLTQICNDFRNARMLRDNLYQYKINCERKNINFSNVFDDNINEYREKTINFATKIYQSIG